jgi:hypothetical protein
MFRGEFLLSPDTVNGFGYVQLTVMGLNKDSPWKIDYSKIRHENEGSFQKKLWEIVETCKLSNDHKKYIILRDTIPLK